MRLGTTHDCDIYIEDAAEPIYLETPGGLLLGVYMYEHSLELAIWSANAKPDDGGLRYLATRQGIHPKHDDVQR